MRARCIHGATELGARPGTTLIVIGNFDGVHRGHQAVLASSVAEAERLGVEPVVLTFDPHPSEVVGGSPAAVLTTLGRKVELICRFDERITVVVEPFTITGVGRGCYIVDPAGVLLGLHAYDPNA